MIQESEENYKTGWIKLFRSIKKHWIWSNEKYLKCWIWFLLEANYQENKMLFSGNLITVEKGQFITSLKHISESSKLSIQEARHFLSLLEKDEMIIKISNTQSTKITICNYGIYQDVQQTNNKRTTNEQQTNNTPPTTNKNVKNDNNAEEEEEEELKTVFSFDDFWNLYDKKLDTKSCSEKYSKLTEIDRLRIKETLPLYLATIKDKQYQKHPKTYLNNQCWNDEAFNKNESTTFIQEFELLVNKNLPREQFLIENKALRLKYNQK